MDSGDARGDGFQHLFQQGQFGAQHRGRLGMVLAAFGPSRLAFGGRGYRGRHHLVPWHMLVNLQGIRPARLDIDQRNRQERQTGNGPAGQARIEPSHAMRVASRFADHHIVTGQQIHPRWLQQVGTNDGPQQRGPVQGRLIPALQRPATSAPLTPARQSQGRHAARNAQQSEDQMAQLPQRRARQIGGKTHDQGYNGVHGLSVPEVVRLLQTSTLAQKPIFLYWHRY